MPSCSCPYSRSHTWSPSIPFLGVDCCELPLTAVILWQFLLCDLGPRWLMPSINLYITSGIQTNIFSSGASWAPKTKWLGAQTKTKGPRVRGKLNPFQCHCQAFALLIRDPQNLYSSNYLPYLKSAEWRFVNFQQLVSVMTRLHTGPLLVFFPAHAVLTPPLNSSCKVFRLNIL